MSAAFIRPEVRHFAARWREVLGGVAVALLGLWWALAARPPLSWVGFVLVVAGVAVALAGWQRARFRRGGGGAGVVQLDEGRLTYFGPLSGGSVAVRDVHAVGLDPRHKPLHWVLSDDEGTVQIPVDAEGTDALFDVLARLPGIDTARVLGALEHPPQAPVTLWQTPSRKATPPQRRLH